MPTDLTLLVAGQSLAVDLCTYVDGPGTPLAGIYQWNGTAFVPPFANGAIALANAIKSSTGANVYLIPAGSGGSSLLPSGNNSWAQSGGLRAPTLATIAAAGRTLDGILWIQGQGDYLINDATMRPDYHAQLADLYTFFQTSLNLPGLPFFVMPAGKAAYPPPGPTMSRYVIQAQLDAVDTTPGMVLGPPCFDLDTRDGTHLTGSTTYGLRIALAVLHQFWPTAWPRPGHGPRILSVSRRTSVPGSTSNVKIITDASILWPSDVWANPSWKDGFRAYKDDSLDQVGVTQVYVMGNVVILNVSWDGQLWISYQPTCDENWGSSVYDDNDPFNTGHGLPLTPLPVPMST